MSDLSKEVLAKLAEVAGYELKYPKAFFTKDNFLKKCQESELFFIHPNKTNRHFEFNWWQPAEKIEQAMEVLNSFCDKNEYHFNIGQNKVGCMQVKLLGCLKDSIDYKVVSTSCDDFVIPRTICKAILKAKGDV